MPSGGDFGDTPDIEPDAIWKNRLRGKIESEFSSEVAKARRDKEQRLANRALPESERQLIETNFQAMMKSLARIADDRFKDELEIERQRRIAMGNMQQTQSAGSVDEENIELHVSDSFIRQQQKILDAIRRSKGGSNRVVEEHVPSQNANDVATSSSIGDEGNVDVGLSQHPRSTQHRYSSSSNARGPSFPPMNRAPEHTEVFFAEPEEDPSLNSQSSITRKLSSASMSSARSRQESLRVGGLGRSAASVVSRTMNLAISPPVATSMRRDNSTGLAVGSGSASSIPSSPPPMSTFPIRRDSNASVASSRSGVTSSFPRSSIARHGNDPPNTVLAGTQANDSPPASSPLSFTRPAESPVPPSPPPPAPPPPPSRQGQRDGRPSYRSGLSASAPRARSPLSQSSQPATVPISIDTELSDEDRAPLDSEVDVGGQSWRGFPKGKEVRREEGYRAQGVRHRSSAGEFQPRRPESRVSHGPIAIPSAVSPDSPRTPDSYRNRPSSYSSIGPFREPEEFYGVSIPSASRAIHGPQISPVASIGRSVGRKYSVGIEDNARYPSRSPESIRMPYGGPSSWGPRRNSVGSYRSGRSSRSQSSRPEMYNRNGMDDWEPAMSTYEEQSNVGSDQSDMENDWYSMFDLDTKREEDKHRADQWDEEASRREEELKQKEEAVKQKEETLKRKEEEAMQRVEEVRRKEEDVSKMEEDARKMEEDARRKEEEARKREEDTRKKEEEARRREEDSRKKEDELRRRVDDARKKEDEARKREDDARRMEEELRRREEDARRKEDEARKREEDARKKEEDARRKEDDARRKEEDARKKEEDARQRAEEAMRRAEEARIREEALLRKEEEFRRKEEELRRREEELDRREAETKRQEDDKRTSEYLADLAKQDNKRLEEVIVEQKRIAAELAERQEERRRAEQLAEELRIEQQRRADLLAEHEQTRREQQMAKQEARRQQLLFEQEESRRQQKLAEQEEAHRAQLLAQEEEMKQAEDLRKSEDLARQLQREEELGAAEQEQARRAQLLAQEQERARFEAAAEARRRADAEAQQIRRKAAEEEKRKAEAEERHKREEFLKQQEEVRRRAEDRKRQDSSGSTPDSQRSGTPYSSAFPSAGAGAWSIPNRHGSTGSNSSDRTGAPSSSWSSAGSAWSAWSNATSSTQTSGASRTATPASNTAKPAGGAWKTASANGHATPEPSSNRKLSQDEHERSWHERLEETARKQAEQFQKEQERFSRMAQKNQSKSMNKDEVIRVFVDHERQWSHLQTMEIADWNSFPWPALKRPSNPEELTTTAISAYIFSPHNPSDKPDKDRLKEQIRRWYPDRFETKLLPKVRSDDREKVKEGAGQVVRSLNDLLTRAN